MRTSLICFLALVACTTSRAEEDKPTLTLNWRPATISASPPATPQDLEATAHEEGSAHYRVRFTHAFDMPARVNQDLESLYRDFHETFGDRVPMRPIKEKMKVVVSAEPVPTRLRNGHVGLVPGYYLPATQTAVVHLGNATTPWGTQLSSLRHEAAHQLFDVRVGIAPVRRDGRFWYREGLACYFEGTGMYRLNGKVRTHRLAYLRMAYSREAIPDIRQLIDPSFASDGGGPTEYALAWSFAHFLIHGEQGKHQEALFSYLANLQDWNRQHRGLDIFNKIFPDLEVLQAAWVKHIYLIQRGDAKALAGSLLSIGDEAHEVLAATKVEEVPVVEETEVERAALDLAKLKAIWRAVLEAEAQPAEARVAALMTSLKDDPLAVPGLIALYKKGDSSKRVKIIGALTHLNARSALRFLMDQSLSNPNRGIRHRAAFAVKSLNYGIAPERYFDSMRRQVPARMQRIVEALELIGDRHAIPYLEMVEKQLAAVRQPDAPTVQFGNGSGNSGFDTTGFDNSADFNTGLPRRRSKPRAVPVIPRPKAENDLYAAVQKALARLNQVDR